MTLFQSFERALHQHISTPSFLWYISIPHVHQICSSTCAHLFSLSESLPQEAVRWALAVVGSRAFPDGSGAVMLCPLLDLLNHHPPRQSGGAMVTEVFEVALWDSCMSKHGWFAFVEWFFIFDISECIVVHWEATFQWPFRYFLKQHQVNINVGWSPCPAGPACGYLRLGDSVGMVAERDIEVTCVDPRWAG